jgi:hypothetical protein
MIVGFSALLKLACLNRAQREAALLRRLRLKGGYDFHKRTRLYCARLAGGASLAELSAEVRLIGYAAERESILRALSKLDAWLKANPGTPFPISPTSWTSPANRFSVKFAPEFGLQRGDIRAGYCVWNTRWPDLHPDARDACMSLLVQAYRRLGVLHKFHLLSLLTGSSFAFDEEQPRAALLAEDLVKGLERTIGREIEGPHPERGEPLPTPGH